MNESFIDFNTFENYYLFGFCVEVMPHLRRNSLKRELIEKGNRNREQ